MVLKLFWRNNKMLNHIIIMGRLTRDPELRRTGSGLAVANFTVCDLDCGVCSGLKVLEAKE
jgi:single-strand DNA-binding protein